MPALCTGSSRGSLRKEDRTGHGLERFLNAAPTPACRQRPSDARSISQDKSSVCREGVRAERTACKRGMITDERATDRVNPPNPHPHLPRPLVICLCFDYISHRTVVSNDKSRDGNPMLSDMGRLGSVKIYLRLEVAGNACRRSGVVFRSSAPLFPVSPPVVRRSKTPLRRGRRRGPSAGTSDCFPSEEPL